MRKRKRTGKVPPLLIKGAAHIKKQTGLTCCGALAYDLYYAEYSCISCGWCADGQSVIRRVRAAQRKGTEVVLR